MKILDESGEKIESAFNPFNLTIRIESLHEAKLLYHVFNHPELRKALFHDREKFEHQKTELEKNVPDNFFYEDRDQVVRYILSKI